MAIVYTPIIPKDVDLYKMYRTELLWTMNNIIDGMVADFMKTTATWRHQPVWQHKIEWQLSQVRVKVWTNDEIYGYVNYGTRPHRIEPRRAKVLAFPSSSTPKTTPNVIGSGAGGSSGPTVFSAGVNHPGTKARNFDKVIAAKWQPLAYERIKGAVERTIQRWGSLQ